jgi:16S rRNA (guanine527-N7)-methyltransferase
VSPSQAPPSSSVATDDLLKRWLLEFVQTPGLTSVTELGEAHALHVDDALTALPLLLPGTLVDVGSGGGSPGLPLAAHRPDHRTTLLESNQKKSEFLRRWARHFGTVSVVCERAEEYAAGAAFEQFDNATARALAPPAIALEWALPLVRTGGRFVLYTTRSNESAVAAVAPLVGGHLCESVSPYSDSDRILCVIEKAMDTPARFPRRVGIARKRPLTPPRNA